MLLTIRKQAWGKAEPTEIVEQWEANSPYEMAKPIFSKCDDGTYYTMVKDKVSGKVLTPQNGTKFLEALCNVVNGYVFSSALLQE
jgi:hypothetical protein